MSQTTDRTKSQFQQSRDTEDTVKAVAALFDRQAERYQRLLPSHIKLEDFRNAFLTAVQRRPALLTADRNSFWLALQQCAADGLKADNREAALVIFSDDQEDEDGNVVASKSSKPKQVVYMPMAAGLRKLLRNTGLISTIETELVFRGETIEIWREDGVRHFKHKVNTDPDADRSPQNIIGAYAMVVFKDGTWQAEWMSRKDIDRVRAVSRAKSARAPWQVWPDEMARKTPLRRLAKQLNQSPEIAALAEALDRDPTLGETIDGEATEIAGSIAAPPTDAPRATRNPDRATTRQQEDAQEGAQQTASTKQDGKPATERVDDAVKEMQDRKRQPAGSSQADATAETTRTASGMADATGQQPGQGIGQSEAATTTTEEADGFEAWLVDAAGNETRPEPYTNAVVFASAVEAMCLDTPPLTEDVWEQNEPAIRDACDASEEAARILNAIKTKPILPADRRPSADTAPAFLVAAVALPAMPNSTKPHWPNYIAAVKQRLDECLSPETAVAQFEADKPTYIGRSMQAETQIERHYRAVLARLSGVAPPNRAEEIAAGLKADVMNCQTRGDIKTWSDNTATIRKVEELKALEGGAALYDAVQTFVAQRVAVLKEAEQAAGSNV